MHTAAVTIHSALIGSCRSSAMPPTAKAAPPVSRTAGIFLTMTRRSPFDLSAQASQRLAVALNQRVAVAMATALHQLDAGAPHTVDGLAPGGEDPAVEDLVLAALEERRSPGREGEDIERLPGGYPRRGPTPFALEGLSPAGERRIEEAPSGRGALARREHVARALGEALRVLERAQLGGGVEHDVGIAADSGAAPRVAEACRGEDAVAETRLGDRAQSDDRPPRGNAGELRVRGVRRVHQAPARPERLILEQPLDRPTAAPCHALLHLTDLLRDVNMDGAARGEAHHSGQLLRRHRTEAVGRNAGARAGERADHPAARFDDPGESVRLADEAALPRRGRGAAETAVCVEHRQERQPDAGARGSVRPARPRWKAWLCTLGSPGRAIAWRSSPGCPSVPVVTVSMRPAACATRTPRAHPEGSSADSNHSLAMAYIIPDRQTRRQPREDVSAHGR